MLTRKELFEAEQQMRRWHCEATANARRAYERRLVATPITRSWWTNLARRFWRHPAEPQRTVPAVDLLAASVSWEEAARNPKVSGSPTLALLRAVARGEITPEAAHELLGMQP